MSTQAFSEMDSASASDAVSTDVMASWGRIVRFVKMSALRLRLFSSSSTSREQSRKYELSSENARLLARALIRPYFTVKES